MQVPLSTWVGLTVLLMCSALPDRAIAIGALPMDGLRVASLSVEEKPQDSLEKMSSRDQGDTTIIYWPTATARGGVELVIDNCLVFGQQCGQPAANAVCKRLTPNRPVATKFLRAKPRGKATVVLGSSMDYCSGDHCLGFSEVHCAKMVVLGKLPTQAPTPNPARAQARDQAPIPAPNPAPAEVPTQAQDPRTCKPGFVWRVANSSDLVCVTPESRQRIATENASAASRVDPGGAYGPASCISGFVWREAFRGDTVCVTPEARSTVREENRLAATRRVGG